MKRIKSVVAALAIMTTMSFAFADDFQGLSESDFYSAQSSTAQAAVHFNYEHLYYGTFVKRCDGTLAAHFIILPPGKPKSAMYTFWVSGYSDASGFHTRVLEEQGPETLGYLNQPGIVGRAAASNCKPKSQPT